MRKIRPTTWLALALGLLTLVALARGARDVGYARDEGVYFEASRRYGAWFAKLTDAPGEAMEPESRDRYFKFNHEHPALMKSLGGISARLFAEPPLDDAPKKARDVHARDGGVMHAMPEGAAMRLPAQFLAALGVALLFSIAARRSPIDAESEATGPPVVAWSAGLLAAGWFILNPRVAFHASLHAFDVPIATATLVVALAYRAGLRSRGWAIAAGPILGLAIAVKHNALFLGPLLALHYYATLGLRWRAGHRPTRAQWIPGVLVSMAVIGPLVAIATWPWLWTDTFARIDEYFAFHLEHSYYNMEFLGVNYNRPPLPVSYPWVMTWATIPSVLLLLSGLGLIWAARDDLRGEAPALEDPPSVLAPLPAPARRNDGLLFLLLGLFPILLIQRPGIPIFGGTKHWITAYPFLALAAAHAWTTLWARADWHRRPGRRWAPMALCALVLTPGAWSTLHEHRLGLSQYAPLVGGARGAASLGLNRGFWGHSVPDVLAEGDALGVGPAYVHDVHPYAITQYQREGRWPTWKPSNPGRARVGLLFPELHMTSDEIRLWNAMGGARPAGFVLLDGVPVTVVYARDRASAGDPDGG